MNDSKFPAKEINAAIERWKERLGLQDWEVGWNIGNEYSWAVQNECRASINYALIGRSATITFSPFSWKSWRRSLLHEMLHLVFADLEDMAKAEKKNEKLASMNVHQIIHKLERLIK